MHCKGCLYNMIFHSYFCIYSNCKKLSNFYLYVHIISEDLHV